jgi:CDP-diacylglycerol--glycerol-3-phosphate 3-phosphatidyltransferase
MAEKIRTRVKNRSRKIKEGIKKESKKIESEIKNEVLFNVPNSITLIRLVFTFLFIIMLFYGFSKIFLIIVFAIAAASDWFDGYFARRLKQTTKTGARMDQVIDRVFTVAIVLSLLTYLLLYKSHTHHMILLLLLSTSREIIGLPGFLITLIRNKDPYQVRYIGKVTTFIQSITLGVIILDLNFAIYFAVITGLVGIVAGFDYLKYSLS